MSSYAAMILVPETVVITEFPAKFGYADIAMAVAAFQPEMVRKPYCRSFVADTDIALGYKRCGKCLEVLPIENFHTCRGKKDNLAWQCKTCAKSARESRKNKRLCDDVPCRTVGKKQCSKCKETKSLEDFYKNSDTKDRLQGHCKVCHKLSLAKHKATNPENFSFLQKKHRITRRSREKRKIDSLLTMEQIFFLWEKQQGRCPYCPSYYRSKSIQRIDLTDRSSYHIDHVIPLSKGGTHDITNLILCCPECNLKKQAAAAPVPVQTLLPLQNLQPRRVS